MKNITLKSSQQGVSVLGTVVLILLISFFANLIIKMSPIYTDHWYIKNVAQEISVTVGNDSMSSFELAEKMRKNLMINNVQFDIKKGFKVDGGSSPRKIIIDYTKQENIMFNVDVLISFHEEFILQP